MRMPEIPEKWTKVIMSWKGVKLREVIGQERGWTSEGLSTCFGVLAIGVLFMLGVHDLSFVQ